MLRGEALRSLREPTWSLLPWGATHAILEAGSEPLAGTESHGGLILVVPISRAVRNTISVPMNYPVKDYSDRDRLR